MKISILCGAAAIVLLSCGPAVAQNSQGWHPGTSWNHDEFWRGAQDSPRERISFLQQRIERGAADGSLDRRELRRVQYQLSTIRNDVMRMHGRMTPEWRDNINQRLDSLAQQIRWARGNDRPGYGAPVVGGNDRPGYGAPGNDDRRFSTDYDASRYYRDGPQYQERRLSAQDEVYRGSDGRYYCKRNDGTTGLVIGAIGGATLGNVIDGGHNRAAGTLIGGVLGALAGKAIDQSSSDVRCR